MPSTTSACTVTPKSRFSRQTTPGSDFSATRATWVSGTVRPVLAGTSTLFRSDMASRSLRGVRIRISISLSPSRYWPTGTPVSTVCVTRAIALVVTPSARALSWSISRRSILTFSFQLSLTPTVFGFARITALTWSASWRTAPASGPITRNCTG
ncbi:hypothetical protein D9M70_455990 [compost metagenome]